MAQMHTLDDLPPARQAVSPPRGPRVGLGTSADDGKDLAADDEVDEEDDEDEDDEEEDEDEELDGDEAVDQGDEDEDDDEDEDEDEDEEVEEARTANGQLKRQNGHRWGGPHERL